MFSTLRRRFYRSAFVLDIEGTALIEFALALPVLLIVTLSGLEFTNFIVAHHRVRQMAVMTADNASRLRTPMSEAYMNQLFVGVDKAGAAIDFKNRGRLILSSVQNNTAGNGQWIRWQRCFGTLVRTSKVGGQDKGKNDTSLPDIDGIAAQPGSAIMYAEASYMYHPLFSNPFTSDQEIYQEVAFIVRQRSDFSISGSGASTC